MKSQNLEVLPVLLLGRFEGFMEVMIAAGGGRMLIAIHSWKFRKCKRSLRTLIAVPVPLFRVLYTGDYRYDGRFPHNPRSK